MAGAAKWCQKLDEKDPPAPLFYLRPSAYLDTVEPHEDAKVRPARDMSSKYDVKEEYKEEVSYEVLAWCLRKIYFLRYTSTVQAQQWMRLLGTSDSYSLIPFIYNKKQTRCIVAKLRHLDCDAKPQSVLLHC